MSDKVQVVVADAQVLCRVGLCQVLKDAADVEVVGQAEDMDGLLAIVEEKQVDVVIVDYHQPKFFDASVATQVKQVSPDTNLLVISSDNRKERIYDVLESGVNSFITKQCEEQEILDAVAATASGEKFFCHKILDLIVAKSFPQHSKDDGAAKLSAREKEILTLVAKGMVAKEIAAELHISPHTIYTHRKNILKKLKLTSPTEMIVYALEHGLIELGEK